MKKEYKYKQGDRVKHKKFGSGTILKHDPKDVDYTYLVEFDDGSKAWFAKWQLNKEVELIDRK